MAEPCEELFHVNWLENINFNVPLNLVICGVCPTMLYLKLN